MNYELRITKKEAGFSLIELIIYVAIFSVISAVFVAVLIQLSVGESLSKQQVY